jgi:hypothetical protein
MYNPREQLFLLSLTFLLIFLVFYFSGFSSTNSKSLMVGMAKINITPEKPVKLSGYASRKDLSQGIHDSLFARAVVFEKKEKRIVLLSTDLIGYYGGSAEYIRKSLMENFNLKDYELFLTAIHTHSGPTLSIEEQAVHPNNFEYTKNLNKRLIIMLNEAFNNMEPVLIGADVGSCPVGVNRRELVFDAAGNSQIKLGRNPNGVSDKEVTVVKICRPNREVKGLLFDYATHSTSLGPKNYIISGDVHGLAEQFIESYLRNNIIAPAFVGASGDIDPWYRILPTLKTGNGWIPESVLLGTFLGEEVVHVLEKISDLKKEIDINAVHSPLKLPGKEKGDKQIGENIPMRELNVAVARIGDIAFVGLGGEVLSEIGMAIKSASPFTHTLIITHCNGAAGYVPPKQLYVEGGYEIRTSPFAPEAAEMVVKHVVKLLHEI